MVYGDVSVFRRNQVFIVLINSLNAFSHGMHEKFLCSIVYTVRSALCSMRQIPDQLCVRGMYVSVTCHDGSVYGELLKKNGHGDHITIVVHMVSEVIFLSYKNTSPTVCNERLYKGMVIIWLSWLM